MDDLMAVVAKLAAGLENATPEQKAEYLRRLRDLPEETRVDMLVETRGALVGQLPIGVEGFEHYYFCKYRRNVLPHTREWIVRLIKAFGEETGLMIEGFRGSTKSTVASTMVEYLMGKMPVRSSMIICATEEDSNLMAKSFSDTMEFNVGWKACFPNIAPDKDRGWGADGYFIKDVTVDYSRWIQKVTTDHGRDPSFLAVPVTSGSVGKHVSLCMLLDDIHNDKNSHSKAERSAIIRKIKADILPVMTRPPPRPFAILTFTPWDEEDTYAELKRMQFFDHICTPVYVEDENGEHEFEGKKIKLTWPEAFPMSEVIRWSRLGNMEFARSYLCDLERAKNNVFKYYTYPHEKINPVWPRGAGVDYASIQMPVRGAQGGRSHFALALGTRTPENTLVIVDGIVEQCTQAASEGYVLSMQEKQINFRHTVIESSGKGEEFFNLLRRNPRARIIPHLVKGKKADRLHKGLGHLLENGQLMVSDADTQFLNTFRRFLDRFPNLDEKEKEWDTADAVYHMVSCFPEVASMPAMPSENLDFRKKDRPSPWASLGSIGRRVGVRSGY